jgi:Family of unknown function (DUF6535)
MSECDNKVIEGWIKSIDNVIIFVRTSFSFSIPLHAESHINSKLVQMTLYSTVIAALLSVTISDLKQNPQDTSAFYLENMYNFQVLAGSNASLPSTPAQPPRFSAPKYAIWVNTLLFMSLCLNLFTAYLALWTQQILPEILLDIESPRRSPHYRARLLRILASEWDKTLSFKVPFFSVLLSPFFFFVGISIYLFNLNKFVFGPILCCVCLCFVAFLAIMYWLYSVSTSYHYLFVVFCADRGWFVVYSQIGVRSTSSAGVDDRVLDELFDSLVEDSDFVEFFETIPGFCKSSIVDGPIQKVTNLGKKKLHSAVKQLLNRTWPSNFLSDSEKMRRLVACVNLADAVCLPSIASTIFQYMFPRDWHNALRSVEMGQFLQNKVNRGQPKIALCAQSIVAGIISNVQGSNDRWVSLTADQLGESEDVIRGYLERGNDNVLLANLNHITREILYSLEDDPDMAASAAFILPSLANLDVRNTLPELQSRFLSLWDEIEQAPNVSVSGEIRENLLNLYNAVRQAQGTNDGLNATSSPDNGVPGNSSHSAPLIQAGDAIDQNAQTDTIIPPDSRLATSSPHLSFLAPDLTTIGPPDELSPGGIPEGTRCAATATASSDPTSSGTPRAVGSADTADTEPGEQPTVRSNSSSVLTTSTPTPTIPEVASVFLPHVTAVSPVVAHHDTQDLSGRDPIETSSLHPTPQSDTSAENRDTSDNPT